MSADLHATRRLIAAVLAGGRPDEALAREAQAEIATFKPEVVELETNPTPLADAKLAVTADEVLAVLAPLFFLMENMLVDIRERTGKGVMISNDVANAFISAKLVLKKAGHEVVLHRKVEPLRFLPVIQRG